MADDSVIRWRAAIRYLPTRLRDFHDQKDLFKTIHETVNVEGHNYAKSVDWVTGQCYVIDIFLWFMARHGYVLQKVKRPGVTFDDLDTTIKTAMDKRDREMAAAMGRAAATAGVTERRME